MGRLKNTQIRVISEFDHGGKRIANSAGVRFTNQVVAPPAFTITVYQNKLVFHDGTSIGELAVGATPATFSELGTPAGEGKTPVLDSSGLVPSKGLPRISFEEVSTIGERDGLTTTGPVICFVAADSNTYVKHTDGNWKKIRVTTVQYVFTESSPEVTVQNNVPETGFQRWVINHGLLKYAKAIILRPDGAGSDEVIYPEVRYPQVGFENTVYIDFAESVTGESVQVILD